MKINYLLSRLTREKYINRWVILLIDLFLSVFDRHILGSDQLHFRLRLFKSDSIQRIPGIGLLQPCQFFYMPDL